MAYVEAEKPTQPHARITRMWREWQFDKGQTQEVLVIEVDLETDVSTGRLDSGELDDVVDTAIAHISNGRGDRADFRVKVIPRNKG